MRLVCLEGAGVHLWAWLQPQALRSPRGTAWETAPPFVLTQGPFWSPEFLFLGAGAGAGWGSRWLWGWTPAGPEGRRELGGLCVRQGSHVLGDGVVLRSGLWGGKQMR